MELSKIQTADLSEWKATDLADQLAIMAGQGKPADMSQDEYNSIVRKVVEAYNAARKKETSIVKYTEQEATAEEPKEKTISEEEFARNATQMNKNYEHFTLDDEHKDRLGRFNAVNEKGKEINLTDEIAEAAKLRTSVDYVDTKKPMSQEEYNQAVANEIDLILASIFVARGQQNADEKNLDAAKRNAQDANDLFYNGAKKSVDARIVSGVLEAHRQGTQDVADEKSAKFKNKSFFQGISSKLSNLGKKLSKKLGKVYDQAQEVVKNMKAQGTFGEFVAGGTLAGASVVAALAGAGAVVTAPIAAGLAVYSGYTTLRRLKSVKKNYDAEKTANGNKKYTFSDFFKNHKKDVITTGLYTIVGTAGVVGGAVSAYLQGANALSGAAQATTQATTTMQNIQTASMATRAGIGGGLLATSVFGSDVHDFVNADTADGRWHAVKQIGKKLGVAAVVGVAGYGAYEFISSAHADVPTADGTAHTAGHGPVDMDKAFAKGLFDANGNPQGDWLDTGSNQEAANVVADMDATHYAVEAAGPKEMAIYTRNLKFVPDSDIMVANIRDGLIKIPDGMSPEEAVNIARIQSLNYGNHELLHALKDCDGTEYDLRAVLKNIHDNSWTTVGKGHNLGDLKDFVGDNCRHGIIKQIDCDGNVKIKVINLCKPVVIDNEVVIEQHKPVIKNPDPAPKPIKPDETLKPVDPIDIKEPVEEDGLSNENFRHVEADKDNISQQAGDKTYKLKSTPATEAEIKSTPAGQVSGVKTNGNGLLLGKDGKPLTISLSHQGR